MGLEDVRLGLIKSLLLILNLHPENKVPWAEP